MKNTMFKIVGVFFFACALVALVVSGTLGVTGGTAFMKGAGIWFVDVEEQVKKEEKPVDLGVENYKVQRVLSASKSSTGKSQAGSGNAVSQVDSLFEQKKRELIDKIAGQIGSFATIARQDSVNRDGLEAYFDEATVVEGDEYLAFLEKLNVDFVVLGSQASEMAKLDPDDKKYVSWDKYIGWYTSSYMENVTRQRQEVDARTAEALAQQAAGLKTLGFAGAVFMAFLLFVMLLVAVQIEKNTRKELA